MERIYSTKLLRKTIYKVDVLQSFVEYLEYVIELHYQDLRYIKYMMSNSQHRHVSCWCILVQLPHVRYVHVCFRTLISVALSIECSNIAFTSAAFIILS